MEKTTMLAERYRPNSFEEVIGQEKTIAAMRWYLDQSAGNCGSGLAMLLTGPSGSGKTTLAECAARYWGATDFDIHRVESAQCDVSALRDLADSARIYGAGRGGRKMYLIDEVHTITGRAADRMLSLLEELPAHVLLIGTTTESRVDRWDSAVTLDSLWPAEGKQRRSGAAPGAYRGARAPADSPRSEVGRKTR